MLSQIGISILPGRAILNDFVCTRSPKLSNHQWCCGCWYYDSAEKVQGAGGVDSCETGIATARGEDVWTRALWEFFKTAKDVVTDTSA